MCRSSLRGWLLITIGTVFFLERLGIISWHIIHNGWPLILIAIGINILLKPNTINTKKQ